MTHAEIWSAGPDLFLRFPGESRTHSIRLAADQFGMAIALRILRERETLRQPTLNQPGAPTQALADAMLKALKAKAPPVAERAAEIAAERQEANSFLEELGL